MPYRAPDPHNLSALVGNHAPVIAGDRACAGCGYNLRGLRVGTACPECGLPTVAVANIDDPLSVMPTRVILAFIRGCWVASICVAALLGLVVALQFRAMNRDEFVMCLAALSVLWLGAVLWLTPAFTLPQATLRGFTHRSRLRQAARWLQWGWVIAAFSELLQLKLSIASAGINQLLTIGQVGGFAAGLIGTMLMSILLERLADWTRDADAERMFNWATWGLPIATALLLWNPSHVLMRLAFLLAWLLVAATFPYGLLSLSKSVTLSALHSLEHKDRQRRRNERDRQFDDRVVESVSKRQ
jgi:hypothetical protein